MLSVKYSHEKYQSFVRDFLNEYFIRRDYIRIVWAFAPLIIKLWLCDLTNIVFRVRDRYSTSNKGASPKDVVTGVYALTELVKLYPEFDFYSAVFDSGYDSCYFYLLNNHLNIIPVIELNERSSKPDSRSDLYYFDEKGIPHGKACGHKFRNWGLIKKSFRRKWLYPLQVR